MFSFECANCGHREIVHQDRAFLESCASSNLWPNDEYQEDTEESLPKGFGTIIDGRNAVVLEGGVPIPDFLAKKKKGYRYSLGDCPGFQYKPRERKKVISIFCKNGNRFIGLLPEEWQKDAEQKLSALIEKRVFSD
mgnify:CR=1 FL=1